MKTLHESKLSSTNVGKNIITAWLDEHGVKNYTLF